MKVHSDLWQNKKAIVLQFKMGDFVKFCQVFLKINIFAIRVVFCQKQNSL